MLPSGQTVYDVIAIGAIATLMAIGAIVAACIGAAVGLFVTFVEETKSLVRKVGFARKRLFAR
jgi:hypothetical protein